MSNCRCRKTAGVTAGGAIGGKLGLLAGVGLLAIPGLGPFIAAGPIRAALAGLGVGGVAGALIGMGTPEFEGKRYQDRLATGGIPLSVHCETSEEIKRAKELLQVAGERMSRPQERPQRRLTVMKRPRLRARLGDLQFGCDSTGAEANRAAEICGMKEPIWNWSTLPHSTSLPGSVKGARKSNGSGTENREQESAQRSSRYTCQKMRVWRFLSCLDTELSELSSLSA
jgi:hypothetical protein